MTKTLERLKKLKLKYGAMILLSGILIVAASSCSNKSAAQAKEMAHRAEELRSEMNANIRKGLSEVGTKDGVPFLNSNQNIQKYWGVAQQQARQLSELISQIKAIQPSYQEDIIFSIIPDKLMKGRQEADRMDRIFGSHAVLTDDEARVVGDFMYNANTLASFVGQDRPYP